MKPMHQRSNSRRKGISLIEVLVVLAVLAFLLGILLMSIPKLKRTATKVECQNNLRRLGIAMHDIHDAMGIMPPIAGDYPKNSKSEGTLCFYILPYIEEVNLYKAGFAGNGGYSVWKGNIFRTRLKAFVCPQDTSAPEDGLYKNWLATSNYAANFQVFGDGSKGFARIPATFLDGTSNTMIFAERYQMCKNTPCAWGYPAIYYWAPMFAYYSQGKFQTQPTEAVCNPALAQSPHSAGINVGLGDASVRLVSKDLSPSTWWAACTPAAGDILGTDW
jgi:prepilin-type N-terminal cleavage/methylation domain-containing protein